MNRLLLGKIIGILSLLLFEVSCGETTSPPPETPVLITYTPPPVLSTKIPPSASPASPFIPTWTLTPTSTYTPTITPSTTNTPIPLILRGTVLEHSNCRYGPSPVFLYKYGVLPTSYMEVIGRDQAGTWLLIRAIGGDNPCWLKATLMDVKGDIMSLSEMDPDVVLPWSPYYNALTGVSAVRSGNRVTVFWNRLVLKAGDDSLQTPYLIEAWVCVNQVITFTVVGSWNTAANVPDEPGCLSPSHARIYGAEKHGYTRWVQIPWP